MKKSVKNKSNNYEVNGILYMCCSKCGREVSHIGEEAVSIVCSNCVCTMIPLESSTTYKPTGRPAGWHWMSEFVDKDGNVFHKGKKVPKLKGTLKPTKVSPPKKKKTKRRTQQQMLLAMDAERKSALKKAVQKQKDFLNHNIDKG